jgi:hypothetical protein
LLRFGSTVFSLKATPQRRTGLLDSSGSVLFAAPWDCRIHPLQYISQSIVMSGRHLENPLSLFDLSFAGLVCQPAGAIGACPA